MTRLNWDRVNMENLARRRGAEIVRDEFEPRGLTKRKKSNVRPSKLVRLIPCSYPKCKAQLKSKNLSRHLQKVHHHSSKLSVVSPIVSPITSALTNQTKVITEKVNVITSISLAKELETYLPNLILRMARTKGATVDSLQGEITLDIAEKIRLYFKGRA